MANVLFIDTEYLKNSTSIAGNVDDSILKPYILKAQETHIHQILGTGLYNKIKSEVISTPSGIYLTILNDYIAPCLMEYSLYEAIPFIGLKLTNKSVSKRSSEYSEPADLAEIKFLRNAVLDVAQFQGKRLIDYLKQNISSIPEYQNPGSGFDIIRPNSSSYFNGIYIPKDKKC